MADRASWIAMHILPYEREVRRWLAGRRLLGRGYDVDDIVQEAYARIGDADVSTIRNPRAYFFQTVRNLVLEHRKRDRIVPFEGLADCDLQGVMAQDPDPERVVSDRQDISRLEAVLASLPPQCRQAFVLRKVHGLSQREIAARMGLSESTVEKHLAKALRLVLERYDQGEETRPPPRWRVLGVNGR